MSEIDEEVKPEEDEEKMDKKRQIQADSSWIAKINGGVVQGRDDRRSEDRS